MVQPIQYQVPVADPFAGLMQGLRLGATVQDLQAAQQQRVLQQEQMRQQMMQRQQQMERQRLFSEFALKPNKTSADFQQAFLQFPEFEKSLTESYKGYTEDKLASSLTEQGSVLSAMAQGKPDRAKQILTIRLTGLKNSGAPENQIAAVQQAIQQIDEQPEVIKTMTRARLLAQGDRGKAIVENIDKQLGAGGKIFASVEDKIRAGIVDEKGNALPGTYTRSESGTLQRISEKAEPSFETLTAAQLTSKYGLTGVEPGLYKRRSDTGEISKIGGGGTTINMKTVSPPPKDYRYVYDGQGNVERMEVIPGSKTAKDLEAAATAAQARTQTEIGRANIIVNSLDTLENLVKTQTTLDPVTGRTGALMGQAGAFKAGSKRADAEQAIDTVIANIGFAELNRMRRESPNGAALGNVTERELAFLQRVVGSLDLIQSDPQLLKNISVIREIQNKVINEGLSDADIARYSAMLGLKAKEAAPASRRAEGVVTPAASAATPFPVAPQPTVKLKSLEEHFSGTPAAR
jgi:hypothetical protein